MNGMGLDKETKHDKLSLAESTWRDVRVVEGARLESVYTGNCIKGSNPFLSARKNRLKVEEKIYKCYFLRREFKMNGMGLDKETCQNVKKVASKYGYTVVCDEKEQELEDADLVLPASEQCESVKNERHLSSIYGLFLVFFAYFFKAISIVP